MNNKNSKDNTLPNNKSLQINSKKPILKTEKNIVSKKKIVLDTGADIIASIYDQIYQ